MQKYGVFIRYTVDGSVRTSILETHDSLRDAVSARERFPTDTKPIQYVVERVYDDLLTTAEIAKMHGVSPQWVRYRAGAGKIAGARKIGRDWVFLPGTSLQ